MQPSARVCHLPYAFQRDFETVVSPSFEKSPRSKAPTLEVGKKWCILFFFLIIFLLNSFFLKLSSKRSCGGIVSNKWIAQKKKPPPIKPSHQPTLLVGKPTTGPPTSPQSHYWALLDQSRIWEHIFSDEAVFVRVCVRVCTCLCGRFGAFHFAAQSVSAIASDRTSGKGSEKNHGPSASNSHRNNQVRFIQNLGASKTTPLFFSYDPTFGLSACVIGQKWAVVVWINKVLAMLEQEHLMFGISLLQHSTTM